MSAHRAPTSAEPGFGSRVPHARHRTSRRFDPRVRRERYWLPGEGRYVWLRLRLRLRLWLSAEGIRTADRVGVEAAGARVRPPGVRD
ncbi:bL28 family ribosomal protein [Streptomyces sp. JNUCC 64]